MVNEITGNDGANRLDGKGGADKLTGGRGNDTYVIDDVNDFVVELADEGTDTVEIAAALATAYTLKDFFEV